MTTDKKERDKILARVRALLSMTTENGCTEAEAMNAAAHAAKLMEEYDLAVSDIEALKSEPIKTDTKPYGKTPRSRELHPAARHTSVAIANFFDCRVWRNAATISFFGMKDDVVLAHDLLKLIQIAMDREVRDFKANGLVADGPGVVAQTNSFCLGMAARISERLTHMKSMRTAAVKAKGTELVVIKTEIVTAAHAKMFGTVSYGKSRAKLDPSSEAAYAAGYHAGDRVGLGQQELVKPEFDSRTRRQRVDHALAQQRAMLAEQERIRAAHVAERLAGERRELEQRRRDADAAVAGLKAAREATVAASQVGPAKPRTLWASVRADLHAWWQYLVVHYHLSVAAGVAAYLLKYVRLDPPHYSTGYGFTAAGIFVAVSFILVWLCVAALVRTMLVPEGDKRPILNPFVLLANALVLIAGWTGYLIGRIIITFRPRTRPSRR